jgi:hypothetical protein
LVARDAALTARDAAVAARDQALTARDAALAERDAALGRVDAAMAARDVALAERDVARTARDLVIPPPRRRQAVPATAAVQSPPLESFRNRHQGRRCFLIGNGPSLRRMDLTALQGEIAFTINRGYLLGSLGLPVTPYYLVTDPVTYAGYAPEIRAAQVGVRFYREDVYTSGTYAYAADREPAVAVPFHMAPTMEEGHFATDATKGIYRGYTSILDAAQLSYFMGCTEVYIIGCDLDYHQETTHAYGTGAMEQSRRDVMPIPRALQAMTVAAEAFRRDGRLLANAGVGGRLDSIERVAFDSLFEASPRR